VLFIAFEYRKFHGAKRDEETIRIISARWATKREQSLYRSHMEEMQ
jgi:uncharacterized DUF497 family protein